MLSLYWGVWWFWGCSQLLLSSWSHRYSSAVAMGNTELEFSEEEESAVKHHSASCSEPDFGLSCRWWWQGGSRSSKWWKCCQMTCQASTVQPSLWCCSYIHDLRKETTSRYYRILVTCLHDYFSGTIAAMNLKLSSYIVPSSCYIR